MSNIMEKSGIKAERKTKEGKNMTKNFEFAKDVAMKEAKELGTELNYWLIYNAINGAIFSDELNKVHDEFRTKADMKLRDPRGRMHVLGFDIAGERSPKFYEAYARAKEKSKGRAFGGR